MFVYGHDVFFLVASAVITLIAAAAAAAVVAISAVSVAVVVPFPLIVLLADLFSFVYVL